MQHSLSDELHFTLPADPYLSPFWASDEVLRQLPPTKIMVSTIRYEKQMQKLGQNGRVKVPRGQGEAQTAVEAFQRRICHSEILVEARVHG